MIIFLGTLFTIVLTSIIGLLCGGIIGFIDFPSLWVIILPMMFFLLTTKTGHTINEYIKSSFKRNYEYSLDELEAIANAAKNTIKIIIASGWFGFFAGLIAMLKNLNDPASIGPSISISLITVYYSVAIGYFIFFPVQAWAENKSLKANTSHLVLEANKYNP